MSSAPLKPFLKWAGGKSQLVEILAAHVPQSYGKYIEPFVGGGALFFYLRPQNAILSDSNPELINCYRVVRDHVGDLISLLATYPHNKTFYYDIRSLHPDFLTPLERAARFIYLNKTCYNGLYRVNKKGQFNVPFGSQKNPKIYDAEHLTLVSQALQNVRLEESNYLDVLNQFAEPGDFVYLDPPYHPVGGYSDFKRYTKDFFYEADQVQLSEAFRRLVENSVFCLLTNSNTEFVRDLYDKYPFEIVDTKRNINCNGSKRDNGQDLIVFVTRPPLKAKKVPQTNGNADSVIPLFPGTRFMGSKYSILEFIWDAANGVVFDSVLDAFSGSASVSYLFKTKGKKVYANDLLHFCYHTANALIANNNIMLDEVDAGLLLSTDKKPLTFIQDTFKGLYFSDEDNAFLDQVRTNIDELENPYKRSLALAALVRACLKKRPRGIFAYVGERYNDNRPDVKKNLREHFIVAVQEFNKAVINNNKQNAAFNCDVFDLDLKPDLVYIDPPYYSPHADSDYLRRYHFVEGLVRYWQGVEIQQHTKTKKFKKYPTAFDGKEATNQALLRLFEKFQNSTLMVSYSSNSLPPKSELARMLKEFKKRVIVYQVGHRYSFGTQYKDRASNTIEEYIFVGL